MKPQEQLSTAINIAVEAHAFTYDKGGSPYILHPLHLMNQFLYDPELASIAVLHDAVEDSELLVDELIGIGFSERVTDAIDLLTHRKDDTYEEYIDKICMNPDAIKVKRKDLEHNSDITRLKGVSDNDLQRIAKYHRAFLILGIARDKMKFLGAY